MGLFGDILWGDGEWGDEAPQPADPFVDLGGNPLALPAQAQALFGGSDVAAQVWDEARIVAAVARASAHAATVEGFVVEDLGWCVRQGPDDRLRRGHLALADQPRDAEQPRGDPSDRFDRRPSAARRGRA